MKMLRRHSQDHLLLEPYHITQVPRWQRRMQRLFCSKKIFLAPLILFFLLYIPSYLQLEQPQTHEEELDGWPRNVTRDVRSFIQPENVTTILSPASDICTKNDLFLLVVVCSAVQNYEARKSIRETWAVTTELPDVRVIFLLGESDNATQQQSIEEESKKYGDLLQEGFIDSYNNLTLKSVMLLKWVNQTCKSAQYIMKTDDDTLVNLKPLHKYLLDAKRPLLAGFLICGARAIRDSTHKWYMPRYIYPESIYPNYLSGSGYVMSKEVVQALYKSALDILLLPLEDVYITGLCAHSARIRPSGHVGFTLGKRPMTACALGSPQVITTHRLNPKELKEAWDLVHAPRTHCNTTAPTATPAPYFRGGRKQRNGFSLRRSSNIPGCF